jgi:hypothetical protein
VVITFSGLACLCRERAKIGDGLLGIRFQKAGVLEPGEEAALVQLRSAERKEKYPYEDDG